MVASAPYSQASTWKSRGHQFLRGDHCVCVPILDVAIHCCEGVYSGLMHCSECLRRSLDQQVEPICLYASLVSLLTSQVHALQ